MRVFSSIELKCLWRFHFAQIEPPRFHYQEFKDLLRLHYSYCQ